MINWTATIVTQNGSIKAFSGQAKKMRTAVKEAREDVEANYYLYGRQLVVFSENGKVIRKDKRDFRIGPNWKVTNETD